MARQRPHADIAETFYRGEWAPALARGRPPGELGREVLTAAGFQPRLPSGQGPMDAAYSASRRRGAFEPDGLLDPRTASVGHPLAQGARGADQADVVTQLGEAQHGRGALAGVTELA